MHHSKLLRQAAGFFGALQAITCCLCVPCPVLAAAETERISDADDALRALHFEPQISYSEYYDMHCGEPVPSQDILISGAACREASGGDFSVDTLCGKDSVLIWNSAEGTAAFELDVPESGIYCIEMTYYAMESPADRVELELKLDGSLPFEAASRICLNKVFVNKTDIRTDSRGNQIRPAQVESPAWQTKFLCDPDGLFNTPMIFSLQKGSHTLTLNGIKASLGIAEIRLCRQPESVPYQAPAADALQNTPSALVRLEGESAAYKSAPTLSPAYDNSAYTVSPSDPVKMVYNTIGGANWDQAGQTVTWDIPAGTLPGDGWYKIGVKARQNVMRGF